MRSWISTSGGRAREFAAVIAFFLFVAVLFTWPLVLHLHDGVTNNANDTLCNAWIMSWNAKTIFTHPTDLFQANSFYPSRDVLAFSEILLPISLLASPIYYTTSNPILAYNILLFAGLVFSAFACYLLVDELTGSRWGALAAGAFYSFCPYKMSLVGELHLLFAPFLPLTLLFFYRFMQEGRRKDLALFGAFFLLQSLCSWHYLIFSSLSVALLWIWTAAFARGKREWLRLAGIVAASVIALLLILPFAAPYLRVHSRLPDFERSVEEAERFSADPDDFIRVIPESLFYGSVPPPFREYVPNVSAAFYPGLMALVLALAGLLMRRREGDFGLAFDPPSFRKGYLYFLLLSLASLSLAFGPKIGGLYNPFYMVLYNLGALKMIRFPTRFFLPISLGLAVMAGYGTAKIATRIAALRGLHAGRLASAVLILLLLLELATFNQAVYPIPVWGQVPDVYSWLEGQGEVRIIELPASKLGPGSFRYDDWYIGFAPAEPTYVTREAMLQYLSAYHWKRTANGYSGYLPFFYRRIYTEMQAFPSPRSVDFLLALGIDFVIWHWEWVDEEAEPLWRERLAAAPGISIVCDFGEETVYRIERRDLAPLQDLEIVLAPPEVVPAGEGFNLALILRNPTQASWGMAVEDPQPFRVSFTDTQGSIALEESGEYRVPLFLAPGEECGVPLRVAKVPPEGEYRMEVSLRGSALGERNLSAEIAVAGTYELTGSGALSGRVKQPEVEADGGNIQADGTLPLVLEVENDGDTLWRSRWEGSELGSGYPYGLVYVSVFWLQREEAVWEEQAALLPCDISPGQCALAPILLRPPSKPGRYQLLLGLADKEVGRFGGHLVLDLEVKGGAAAP